MASSAALTDPVLVRLRETLRATYGDRLERAVLFGSRARGDAGPDSDYDVAVFLRGIKDRKARFAELDRLAMIGDDLILATGGVVNALAYRAGAYNDRTPLMCEIRLEGVDL